MQVVVQEKGKSLWQNSLRFSKTAVALGCFDALHIGHQEILKNLVKTAKAEGLMPLVYFFINPPKAVLKEQELPQINTLTQRLSLMEEMGVSVAVAEYFTADYLRCSPEDFVKIYLKERLGARYVAAGFNYRFGCGGQGDIHTLKTLAAEQGICVCGIPCVEIGGEAVSSTRIRQVLTEGNVEEANACLGRAFSMQGVVQKGRQIGREMGFPTANLEICKAQLSPRFGVYITEVFADGKRYPAITNVGARPTVGGDTPYIESHLLGEDIDLYGKEISVAFFHRLRGIEKFADIRALKAQLELDKEAAKKYFEK